MQKKKKQFFEIKLNFHFDCFHVYFKMCYISHRQNEYNVKIMHK